jgi:hypothetical protein
VASCYTGSSSQQCLAWLVPVGGSYTGVALFLSVWCVGARLAPGCVVRMQLVSLVSRIPLRVPRTFPAGMQRREGPWRSSKAGVQYFLLSFFQELAAA